MSAEPWLLSDLTAGLGLEWLGGEATDVQIDEVTIDYREAGPGVLFIARSGWYEDGNKRAREALDRGAAAVLLSDRGARSSLPAATPVLLTAQEDPLLARISARFYRRPTSELEVYGVTGTNGKTSVAWMLAHALGQLGRTVALLSTVRFVTPTMDAPATNTTPDALIVQRFARRALNDGCDTLVLECSSHGLAIGRLAEVELDSVGFTNLSQDHLEFHGSMQAYRAAKRLLFDGSLCQPAIPAQVAVAWHDADGEGAAMLHAAAAAGVDRCVSVGEVGNSDDRTLAVGVRHESPTGQKLILRGGSDAQTTAFTTRLVGDFNRQNLAVAAGMLWPLAHADLGAVAQALASFEAVPGRMERVGPGVWVDYAHTPDAVKRVVELGRAYGPTTVVLGCGGDRDPTKRAPMGRAASVADRIIFTSDNPRSEDPAAIARAMLEGVPDNRRSRVMVELDRAAAIDIAIAERTPDGVVLILGKGHEPYQEGRDAVRVRFDDRAEARRALAGRPRPKRREELSGAANIPRIFPVRADVAERC